MRIRRVGLLAVAALVIVTTIGHSPASARADSVTLTFVDPDGNVDPTAQVARTMIVTTNLAAVSDIYVKYRPAGGAACSAIPHDDPGEEMAVLYATTIPFAGPFSFGDGFIFPASGLEMLCIWLGSASAPSDTVPLTPIVQMVAVRPASATVSATAAPASEPATPATTVTVAGASDFPILVRATYRPTGGPPCAPTYAADPGTTFVDAKTLTSGRFTFAETIPFTGGTWMVCSWLETDATPPYGITPNATFTGPSTTTFTASGPAAPVLAPATPVPLPATGTPAAKVATSIHSTIPHTSRHLRLAVSSRVTSSKQPAGTCWLEVLQAGRWKTPGAHAKVTGKGTCLVSARFGSAGRKRVRIEFRPAAAFAGSDGHAAWVIVTT